MILLILPEAYDITSISEKHECEFHSLHSNDPARPTMLTLGMCILSTIHNTKLTTTVLFEHEEVINIILLLISYHFKQACKSFLY